MDTCETCGNPFGVGDWPWCPHGKARSAAIGDDIPGGMWIENGVPKPIKVYSHSEAARERAKHGTEMRPVWVENDKHLTRWDVVDLEKAKELVSRGTRVPNEEPEPLDIKWEWSTVGSVTVRREREKA